MSPVSANPFLHEYALVSEFKIPPQYLEDQEIIFPSFKDFFKWIFGKPIKVLLRKGIEAKKVDLWLSLLDQKHVSEQEEIDKIGSDFK
jgi:hypothetical protein